MNQILPEKGWDERVTKEGIHRAIGPNSSVGPMAPVGNGPPKSADGRPSDPLGRMPDHSENAAALYPPLKSTAQIIQKLKATDAKRTSARPYR